MWLRCSKNKCSVFLDFPCIFDNKYNWFINQELFYTINKDIYTFLIKKHMCIEIELLNNPPTTSLMGGKLFSDKG